MGTYSDPALILPGSVGQTEVDATLKRNTANGVAGLDASAEVIAPPSIHGANKHNSTVIAELLPLYFYEEDGIVVQGTWTWVDNANQTDFVTNHAHNAGFFYNNTNADNDAYKWPSFYLPIGTYNFTVAYMKYTNRGICQLYANSVALGASFDQYDAGYVWNETVVRQLVITQAQVVELEIKATGKNVASSAYAVSFSRIEMEKTA